MTKTVRVDVGQIERDDGGLDGIAAHKFLAELQELVDQVPDEFKNNAVIRLHGGGFEDSTDGYITVCYDRPETAQEVLRREAMTEASMRRTEQIERAQFERLQAKFGGKP